MRCNECGSESYLDEHGVEICTEPLCEYSLDTEENQLARFKASLKDEDFAIGDSFWIGAFEFTVTNSTYGARKLGLIYYTQEEIDNLYLKWKEG